MAEMYLKNAQKINCYAFFPETALSAKLKVTVTPKDGAVLIYTPETRDKPIRFSGPETTADVPVKGHEMYAQMVGGATHFEITALGWIDDI